MKDTYHCPVCEEDFPADKRTSCRCHQSTKETDAYIREKGEVGLAEFARRMERERNAEKIVTKAVIKNYDIALESKKSIKRERDDAIKEREALVIALMNLRNAALKHKMDPDDLEIEDANKALGVKRP